MTGKRRPAHFIQVVGGKPKIRMGDTHLQQVVSKRRRGEEGQEEGAGTHQQASCLIGAGEGRGSSQRQVGRVSEEIEGRSLVVSVWRWRRRGRNQEWWCRS